MENENIEYIDNTVVRVKDHDFQNAIKEVINKKKKILFTVVGFFVIGVIYAFLSPKEYTADTVILPQMTAGGGIKNNRLASLIGFKIGGQDNGNFIMPSLYPMVIKNINFQKELLSSNIQVVNNTGFIKYSEYLENYNTDGALHNIKKYTVGLPGLIANALRSKGKNSNSKVLDSSIVMLSKAERGKINLLEKQIKVVYNDNDGYLQIEATANDPLAVAQIVNHTQSLLQKRIINYNIQKSKEELEFIEKRLKIAKEDYTSRKAALGAYQDRNRYSITSYTKNVEEQLKSEYELSYDVYSELASQYESTKLQIAKDTPIFSIIRPAIVPEKPSAPNMIQTIFLFTFLGFVIIVSFILFKFYIPFIKSFVK